MTKPGSNAILRWLTKRDLLFIGVACLAYLVSLQLGLIFLAGPEEIASFWPAAGVLVAVLLLRPELRVPMLLAAGATDFVFEGFSRGDLLGSFGYSLPNMLECWLGAWLITRFAGPRPTMRRVREGIGTASSAMLAGGVGSLGSAMVARSLGHVATHFSFVWWFADSLSILFLVPIAMTVRDLLSGFSRVQFSWRSVARALLLGAVLMVVLVLILQMRIQPEIASAFRPFIVVLPLLWAAVEFGTIGVVILTVTGASVTIFQTAQGAGLFAFSADTATNAILRAQLFWATSFTTTMVIASILNEVKAARWRQDAAESALQISEERSRLALESTSDALLDWHLKTGDIYVSPRYFAMLGFGANERKEIELGLKALIEPGDAEGNLRSMVLSAPGDGSTFENEYQVQNKQGQPVWVQCRGRIVERTSDGEPVRFVGALLDVTERKRVAEERSVLEQQLRLSTERLELATTGVNDGIWDWDKRRGSDYWSPRWLQMLGYEEGELKPSEEQWKRLIHPGDLERVQTVFAEHLEGRTPFYQVEFRMQHKDGSYRWILSRGLATRDESQKPVRVAGSHTDITERKLAEAALEQSERRLRLFVEHAPAAIAMFDREMRYLVVSRRYLLDYRVGERDVVGRLHYDVFPDAPERWKEVHQRCLNGAVEKNEEDVFRRTDGSEDWIQWEVRPWHKVSGEIGGIILFSEVLTERKRAEKALQQESEFRQLALEASALGAWDYRFDMGTVFWDERCRNMFGIPRGNRFDYEEAISRIHPDDREATKEAVSRAISGEKDGHYLREYRIIWDDGSVHWVASYGRVYFEGEGEHRRAARFIGVNIEITERKRAEEERLSLEEQLRQAQKMEAVGRLASGIAHDFNNLLMIIRSYTEMLKDKLLESDSLHKYADEVLKASARAASLTGQMLAFSRKQMLSPVVLNLNAVVNETAEMLKRLIGEDIEFQVKLDDQLWPVQADSDQIGQVLMNLSVNARDAMPRGGRLTIRTQNLAAADCAAEKCPTYVAPLDYVKLSLTDSGTGMSKEVQEHMFEPFFTTKTVGKGTGLGLSTVYGIVKQSGGYVWAESETDHGTRFNIVLPRRREHWMAAESSGAARSQRGTETLLVVEDENPLRESICEYLRGLGYTVLGADSGPQALAVCNQHSGHIDLMVSDVVMPRMSGGELLQQLEKQRPELKTIFMSGYSDDALVRHGMREAGVSFLQKPFSLNTLADKVRDVLDALRAQ